MWPFLGTGCWNTCLADSASFMRKQVPHPAQGQKQHTARLMCRHHLMIRKKCEWSFVIEALIWYSSVHPHKTLKHLFTYCISWKHLYWYGFISQTCQSEHINKNKRQFHVFITYHSGKHRHLANDWLHTSSRQTIFNLRLHKNDRYFHQKWPCSTKVNYWSPETCLKSIISWAQWQDSVFKSTHSFWLFLHRPCQMSSKLPVTPDLGYLMFSSGLHRHTYIHGINSHRHTDT